VSWFRGPRPRRCPAPPQAPAPPPPAKVDLDTGRKIGNARKWLLAISILMLLSGLGFYAINKSEVEKQIRDAEAQLAGMDPVERDQRLMERVGMTWDQVMRHDRGQVNLLLAENLGLAAVFLGLWFWAKRNALGACVVALLLFVTVIAVNGALAPKTLAMGIPVKVIFVAALIKAITAAQQDRKLAT
jgi:hypothetical protein